MSSMHARHTRYHSLTTITFGTLLYQYRQETQAFPCSHHAPVLTGTVSLCILCVLQTSQFGDISSDEDSDESTASRASRRHSPKTSSSPKASSRSGSRRGSPRGSPGPSVRTSRPSSRRGSRPLSRRGSRDNLEVGCLVCFSLFAFLLHFKTVAMF